MFRQQQRRLVSSGNAIHNSRERQEWDKRRATFARTAGRRQLTGKRGKKNYTFIYVVYLPAYIFGKSLSYQYKSFTCCMQPLLTHLLTHCVQYLPTFPRSSSILFFCTLLFCGLWVAIYYERAMNVDGCIFFIFCSLGSLHGICVGIRLHR